MAKSPKKVPAVKPPNAPDAGHSGSPPLVSRMGLDMPDALLLGIDSPAVSQAASTSAAASTPPTVTVHALPDATENFSATRNAIAWPQERFHELVPVAQNEGLFTGPDQRTYAQIANEGQFVVEQDGQGNYHVPLTFAPGVPGLPLTRLEGQTTWQIRRPERLSNRPASATPNLPSYISPADAMTLSKPELATEGLRYNRLRQTFVTTVDGTVMVRKNKDGEYQQAFASTSNAPDVFFEQIPGTVFWRQKPPGAKPSQTQANPASQANRPTRQHLARASVPDLPKPQRR